MPSSKKILLIDNDIECQALITNTLEPANYRVKVSLDGDGGFELAKKDKPDLVIIAVELPDANGYLLCKKFREFKSLKDIPIILISRDAKPKDFEQHRKLKIRGDEYLLKPFGGEVILSKVQNLIGFHITEKEFDLMQEHLNSMIQEKILLDDKISTIEKENEELATQLKSVQNIREELKAAKEKEARMLQQVKDNKEHINVVDKWLTEANEKAEKLQIDNDKVTKENTLLKTELENVKRQFNDLNATFNALQNKIKKNNMNIEKLKLLLNQAVALLAEE